MVALIREERDHSLADTFKPGTSRMKRSLISGSVLAAILVMTGCDRPSSCPSCGQQATTASTGQSEPQRKQQRLGTSTEGTSLRGSQPIQRESTAASKLTGKIDQWIGKRKTERQQLVDSTKAAREAIDQLSTARVEAQVR